MIVMLDHLFNYFQEEIILREQREELDEENKHRDRFMYFLSIVFILLLICSFFNII